MNKRKLIAVLLALAVVCLAVWSSSNQPEGMGGPRSPQWPAVRARHLLAEPCCQACGRRTDLEVHHVEPFHVNPARELDPENLITLCRRCHTLFGHLDDFRSWNKDVREDAGRMWKRIKGRPKGY